MKTSPCVLGLLSDSHGRADATEHAAARLVAGGATCLLHLGDLCGEGVVDALAGHATPAGTPVGAHLVWGNCDAGSGADARYARALGIEVHDALGWLEADGKTIAFTHGHLAGRMAQALAQGADFLLHGHLHRRLDFPDGRTRVICAGSVAYPRDGLPPVAALLWPGDGRLEWVEVAP